jgi:CheY-like chemotaxis protein
MARKAFAWHRKAYRIWCSLDLLLPDIQGEEILYALKRDVRTQSTPVIVVTNVAASNAARLKAAGAAEYFESRDFSPRRMVKQNSSP